MGKVLFNNDEQPRQSALPDIGSAERPVRSACLDYRAASFHAGHVEEGILDDVKSLGFNAIELQVEGDTLEGWERLRSSQEWRRLTQWCRENQMDIALWTHELSSFDPAAVGTVSLDNHALWGSLAARYRRACRELFPEVRYFVLTVVESQMNVTERQVLQRLVEVLDNAVRVEGRQLIFRPFVWHPWELEEVAAALDKMPPEVAIHNKYVPQDWHFRSIDNRLVGGFPGRREIVEYGIAGEYMRERHLASFVADELFARQQRWLESGINGVSVRVNRFARGDGCSNSAFFSLQECNLWAMMPTVCGLATTPEQGLLAYAEHRFGQGAAPAVADALLTTGKVNREALCVEGETFGDPRAAVPALATLQIGKTVERFKSHWMRGVIIPEDTNIPMAPFVPYEEVEDFVHRNPFFSNWSSWRWDKSLKPAYEAMRRGEPSVIGRKQASYAAARQMAVESLAAVEQAQNRFDDPEAYRFLHWRLGENLWHLDAMCNCALAWLNAARCLYTADVAERDARRRAVLAALSEIERLHCKASVESATIAWRGQSSEVRRGEYLRLDEFVRLFHSAWERAGVLSSQA